MNIDLVNSLTFVGSPGKSQATNNNGAFVADLGANFDGVVAFLVNIGVKTVGDADGNIAIYPLTSATNNISNAVNYGSSTVVTTNNNTICSAIAVDTRDAKRYLFWKSTISGTNSPAYPVSVVAVGRKKVQPAAS